MSKLIRDFVADESGATAIEYALIASAIAGVLVATVYTLGDTVFNTLYEKIADAVTG